MGKVNVLAAGASCSQAAFPHRRKRPRVRPSQAYVGGRCRSGGVRTDAWAVASPRFGRFGWHPTFRLELVRLRSQGYPGFFGVESTGGATPSGLPPGSAAGVDVIGGRGGRRDSGGASVVPRLARPASCWRLWIQAQVAQDLLDHLPLDQLGAGALPPRWDGPRPVRRQ